MKRMKKKVKFNKYLMDEDSLKILNKYGYILPNNFYNTNEIAINLLLYNVDLDLQDIIKEIKNDVVYTKYENYILVLPKNKQKYIKKIDDFNVLSTYYQNLVNLKNEIKK